MKSAHIIKRCTVFVMIALLLFSLACGSPHITGFIKMESYDAVKKAFKGDERFIFPDISGFIPEGSVISYEVWREDPLDNTSPFIEYSVFWDGSIKGRKVDFQVKAYGGKHDRGESIRPSLYYNGVEIIHTKFDTPWKGFYIERFTSHINGCEYDVCGSCLNSPTDESEFNEMCELITEKIYPVVCRIIDEAQK